MLKMQIFKIPDYQNLQNMLASLPPGWLALDWPWTAGWTLPHPKGGNWFPSGSSDALTVTASGPCAVTWGRRDHWGGGRGRGGGGGASGSVGVHPWVTVGRSCWGTPPQGQLAMRKGPPMKQRCRRGGGESMGCISVMVSVRLALVENAELDDGGTIQNSLKHCKALEKDEQWTKKDQHSGFQRYMWIIIEKMSSY